MERFYSIFHHPTREVSFDMFTEFKQYWDSLNAGEASRLIKVHIDRRFLGQLTSADMDEGHILGIPVQIHVDDIDNGSVLELNVNVIVPEMPELSVSRLPGGINYVEQGRREGYQFSQFNNQMELDELYDIEKELYDIIKRKEEELLCAN